MDDWNLDEFHLVSDNNSNIVNLYVKKKEEKKRGKEWQIILRLSFSVGDTTQVVYK